MTEFDEKILAEFDKRFAKNIWKFIDREMTEEQRQVLFGKDSEYFGAIKSFLLKIIHDVREEERNSILAALPKKLKNNKSWKAQGFNRCLGTIRALIQSRPTNTTI